MRAHRFHLLLLLTCTAKIQFRNEMLILVFWVGKVRLKNMQLSYYEKVNHNTHEISQDTPIWDKYSVKYTQLNIQFGLARKSVSYTHLTLPTKRIV